MFGGCRCCLAGLPNFTFPARYSIKDALADPHWVNVAQPVDVAEDEIISGYTDTGMAIIILNKPATCIVFANKKPAQPWDPMASMVALSQCSSFKWLQKNTRTYRAWTWMASKHLLRHRLLQTRLSEWTQRGRSLAASAFLRLFGCTNLRAAPRLQHLSSADYGCISPCCFAACIS